MSAATKFTLKPVIMARALAEMTVLVILSALPLILILCGKFFVIHLIFRVATCVVAPFSMFGLWGFGQLSFQVIVDDEGLTTRSVLRRQNVQWSQIRALKQTNRLGMREFIIEHASGELSFPYLLNRASELVHLIRNRLPNRGRSTTGDAQTYRMSPMMIVFDIGKLILQFGFAGMFFWFFDSLKRGGKSSHEDLAFVLLMASFFLLSVIWKAIQACRLPQEVQITKTQLRLRNAFFTKDISWKDVGKVAVSNLLFPEGLTVSALRKQHLIGAGIDCFDELAEEIQERCSSAQIVPTSN